MILGALIGAGIGYGKGGTGRAAAKGAAYGAIAELGLWAVGAGVVALVAHHEQSQANAQFNAAVGDMVASQGAQGLQGCNAAGVETVVRGLRSAAPAPTWGEWNGFWWSSTT